MLYLNIGLDCFYELTNMADSYISLFKVLGSAIATIKIQSIIDGPFPVLLILCQIVRFYFRNIEYRQKDLRNNSQERFQTVSISIVMFTLFHFPRLICQRTEIFILQISYFSFLKL